MRIHLGCELHFEFPQPTPMILTLNVHFSRASELERPDYLITNPPVPVASYRDSAYGLGVLTVTPAGIARITVFGGGPDLAAKFEGRRPSLTV